MKGEIVREGGIILVPCFSPFYFLSLPHCVHKHSIEIELNALIYSPYFLTKKKAQIFNLVGHFVKWFHLLLVFGVRETIGPEIGVSVPHIARFLGFFPFFRKGRVFFLGNRRGIGKNLP